MSASDDDLARGTSSAITEFLFGSVRQRLMSDIVGSADFRIRALEFDPQTRVVQVPGRRTVLDARSSRVLEALSNGFGDCIAKDDLMRAGWPNQLVHENSLAKAISKLRRAIDGSGVEIAAVYGIGYTLRDSASTIATDPAPSETQPAIGRPRSNRLAVVMLTVVAVLVTAGIGSVAVGRLGQAEVPFRSTAPITNDPPDAVATILWVDDHPSNNALEVEALRRRRVAVHLTESTGDALKLLAINRYSLVVSDLGRGEDRLAGVKMIAAMKQRGMTVPVIIYTIRPKDRAGQETLRRLVADSGASGLAVTPEEVRSSIFRRLGPAV